MLLFTTNPVLHLDRHGDISLTVSGVVLLVVFAVWIGLIIMLIWGKR